MTSSLKNMVYILIKQDNLWPCDQTFIRSAWLLHWMRFCCYNLRLLLLFLLLLNGIKYPYHLGVSNTCLT